MQYRTLGKTKLDVSVLGFGGWGIGGAGSGWIGADDSESLRALQRAVDLGVNFIDTAYAYGEDGHSERLIGQAVRQVRETVYVATKIPPKQWGTAEDAFPADWIVECTETSLKRLGLECIDVQQFHAWQDEWLDQGDWLEAVEQLKKDGKIQFFGVSINDHQPSSALELVRSGHLDTVQVIYNIFDQSPEADLFPAVHEANVGVIVRVPFDEGALTGNVRPDTSFAEGDFRNHYFQGDRKQEVWDRVTAIARDTGTPVDELAQLALRFCITHPAVATVIPGMRSTQNVERNAAAVELGELDASILSLLRKHQWTRNFYG